MAKKTENLLDLPVSFGSVSFGKKTARVGVNVEREHLKIAVADKNLCDRRLSLTIVANGSGDQPGQKRLEGMEEELELTGVADVKGFGVHSTTIGFGLTFNANEMNRIALSTGIHLNHFAAREGRLMIVSVEEIPEDEETEEDDAADEGDE